MTGARKWPRNESPVNTALVNRASAFNDDVHVA
jgi:hypothetical protein